MQEITQTAGRASQSGSVANSSTPDMVEGKPRVLQKIVLYGHSEAIFALAKELRTCDFVVSVFRDTHEEPVNLTEVLDELPTARAVIVELSDQINASDFRHIVATIGRRDVQIGVIATLHEIRTHGHTMHFGIIPYADDEVLQADGTGKKVRLLPCDDVASEPQSVAERIARYLAPMLI